MNLLSRMPIRYQLRLIVIIMALPMVGLIVNTGIQQRKEALNAARKDTQKLADKIAFEQQGMVASARQLMASLSQLPEIKHRDVAKVTSLLGKIHKVNPGLTNVFVADRSGSVWTTAVPVKPPFIIADRRYFKSALANSRLSSGEYVVSRATNRPTFNLAYPIIKENGDISGVICVGFSLAKYAYLLEKSSLPLKASFVLLDHKGTLLYRAIEPEKFIGNQSDPVLFKQLQELPDESTVVATALSTKDERIISTRKLRIEGESSPYMFVRVGIPVESVLADSNTHLLKSLMFLSFVLIGALLFSGLIGKYSIVDRIALLEKASQSLANGDYRIKVGDQVKGGELGRLAESFDSMVNKLILREEALTHSERFLNTIIETEPDCIKLLDADCNLLMMNRAGLEMIEADSLEQVKGQCVVPLIAPEYQDDFIELAEKGFQGVPGTLEFEITGIKGRHTWLETHTVPFRNEKDEITAVLGITRDITSRKRAEEIFRIVFRNAPVGLLLSDNKSVVLDCNQQFAEILGSRREAFLGLNLLDTALLGEVSQNLVKTILDGKVHKYEGPYLSGVSGKKIDVSLSTERVAPELFITVVMDITERRLAERQLKTSEKNYRNLAGLTSDYVFKCFRVVSDPFRIQWVGGSISSISGYSVEEIYEMGCWLPIVHPDDRQDVASHLFGLAPGDQRQIEFRIVTKDGRICWITETSRCEAGEEEGQLVLYGAAKDVTSRKFAEHERDQLTKQLLHAQKLESLGVLAGGIAHDFNNILMAVIGNAELALMRMNPESPAIDNLHKIEQAAARATDLAKQMLAYSGKGKFVVEHLSLNRLLEEMLHMLEVSISKKAILRVNLTQNLPSVEADATQLRQIIMNLVINASEAIGDKSGVIAITTGCMDCDHDYLKNVLLCENISEGLYLYLEIADSGCGMDSETMAKIFDPFFTTKFTGRGLGMAAVLGIVRGHKGAIKIYSEPGKGSSFKILLPASGKPEEIFNLVTPDDNWRGGGHVLLVDDEETVLGVGAEMLKELGFEPITARDGRQALEQFRNNSSILFVILDLTMPHMDGEQCFRELRQINPDVKVIISSGFNEQEVTQKFVGKGLAGFIQKPYKLSVLKEVIKYMI